MSKMKKWVWSILLDNRRNQNQCDTQNQKAKLGEGERNANIRKNGEEEDISVLTTKIFS